MRSRENEERKEQTEKERSIKRGKKDEMSSTSYFNLVEKLKLLTWVQVNLGKIFWIRNDLLRVDPIRLKPW